MAIMEMEHALAKLKLGPKKDPNDLLNEFTSIKCQYLLDLSESKKKAQILQLGVSCPWKEPLWICRISTKNMAP